MDLDREGEAVGPLTVTRNGRRYFGAEHKRLVVERCLARGASVAAVALAHGFNANLVRRWIRQYQASEAEAAGRQQLIPVSVVEEVRSTAGRAASKPVKHRSAKQAEAVKPPQPSQIEIQIGTAIVRLHGNVEATTLRTVLQALGHAR